MVGVVEKRFGQLAIGNVLVVVHLVGSHLKHFGGPDRIVRGRVELLERGVLVLKILHPLLAPANGLANRAIIGVFSHAHIRSSHRLRSKTVFSSSSATEITLAEASYVC